MAIQNRRGEYNDFDPQKLVPGEWAVVLSGDPNSVRGKAVYMAFDVGDIERMATYEDMQENIVSATTDVQAQFADELTQTIADANTAVTNMRSDVDDEIASATNAVDALTRQVNTATNDARSSTAQALSAANTATAAAQSVQSIIDGAQAVLSWNDRVGLVVPQIGDYTSALITHGDTTVEDALEFDSAPTANSTRAVQSGGVFAILGNTALGTVATTITGAIKELLTRINANTSNVSDARNRVAAVETKTAGIVRTTTYSVAASARDYKQLSAVSTYMLIVNTAYPSDTMKGIYLIGMAGNNVIGVKAVSNASNVVVEDGGNGLLRVINNGEAYIRCTLITTYSG